MRKRAPDLTLAQVEYLRVNFPVMSNKDLAERLGVTIAAVKTRARRMHLYKSKEFMRELHSRIAKEYNNVSAMRTPEAIRLKTERLKRTLEIDRIRIKWGLEQKTKFNLSDKPQKYIRHTETLRQHGYIIDDARKIAYYTPLTRRCPFIERVPRGETRGRIHGYYDFLPFAENEN